MRKKAFLRIVAGIAVFLLIAVVFFIANSFLGNPISANIAKNMAKSYIKNNYSHLNLEIRDVTYNLKDGSYFIFVSSNTSIDTHFSMRYRDKEIFKDDYEMSVLSGMNTMDRFRDEYRKSLIPLVQAKTSNVINISVIPEKLTKYDIGLDSPFDKKLVKNVSIVISCIGGTDAKHLSKILKISYDVMKENGYSATNFGIIGEHETLLTELRNIKPIHIEKEDLEEILQEAITNTEYDGITAFTKGLK